MQLLDASEIVFGLILQKKIDVEHVNPTIFSPPYGEGIKLIKTGAEISDLYDKVGLAPIRSAIEAGNVVSDGNPYDFLEVLQQAFGRESLAQTLEREMNKLRKGEEADLLAIETAMTRNVEMENRYTSLYDIEPSTGIWVPTGYQPFDEYIGGIPEANLTIIGAPPGCLIGSTMVGINRAGKSFKISMKDLELMHNGGKRGGRAWDKKISTKIRSRFDNGSIRLANIKSVLYSGEKKVYNVLLADGKNVTGTIDHPIYTEHGWKEIGELKKGDLVWVEASSRVNVNYYTEMVAVESVDYVGIEDTYDIAIDGEPHNFLANEIVVHNTGKTSLLVKLIASMARTGKKVLFYTLEMTGGQISQRVIDIESDTQHETYKKNVTISSDILNVEEICTEASRVVATDDYGMIAIDFADLMLSEKEEEGNVAHMYRSVARLAKKTGVATVLLSQLNRSYAEHGGIPRIHNIRWSGLAEAMAALILLIYNPNQIYGAPPSKNTPLIAHPGRGYVIVGKSRFGYKQGSVGAIDIEWDGKVAWGDEAMGWMPLSSV